MKDKIEGLEKGVNLVRSMMLFFSFIAFIAFVAGGIGYYYNHPYATFAMQLSLFSLGLAIIQGLSINNIRLQIIELKNERP